MKSLKICKTTKENQLVPPTARSKCIGPFQIRKYVLWNGAISISRAISIICKFYNCHWSFYGLSNEDLNLKTKKVRNFLFFLFLIFYIWYIYIYIYISWWESSLANNTEGLSTIQLRDCQQITFVMLKKIFFLLNKNHLTPCS